MQDTDNKRLARAVISERLRSFFSEWKQQLASGAEELLKRVETKLNKDK